MKTLLLLAILSVAIAFCPIKAADLDTPLSCTGRMPEPPCATYWRFDTVFIGTVRELVKVPFAPGPVPDWQQFRKITATLTVNERFKGEMGAEVIFEMEDCYFEFKEGEKYLVYTAKGNDGKFHLVRHHTPTRLLSEAGEHLDFIRSLPDMPSGGRIFGDVYDRRVTPTLRVLDEPTAYSRKMPGVTIYLKNGEKTYQTITDATGHYELTRIPAGEYDLSTDLPNFLSGTNERVFTVDKACSNANLWIQATGIIKGRLTGADGKPIEKAVVTIFSADGVTENMFELVRPHSTTRSETDKEGSFNFQMLRPGRYYLAVNMVDEERSKESPASDHPRIFYPGVSSFKDATSINVTNGAVLENVVIKLPALATVAEPGL